LRRCLVPVVLVLSVSFVFGQVAPVDHPDALATITSTSNLVIIPTLVRSQSGELIQTLHANDFRLTDNGVEQRISVDDVERQPLAVVVLMQTGGAANQQFAKYAKLGTMLDYMMGGSAHRVALVTFDSQPESFWSFTSQIDSLGELSHPEQGDDGAAIYDAVNYGIDLLRKQPPNFRRVLLLFSQTYDGGSKAHVEDVVRGLGENNVTIYSLTFSPEKTWLKDQFTKPRHGNPPYQLSPVPGDPPLIGTFNLSTPLGVALRAMRTNAASEIASLSGGEYMEFGDQHDLERQLTRLANHIPNRYMLSFRPSLNSSGFHAIHVQIPSQPSLQISARTSYWSTESPDH
jgi:VWFA-related protein